MNEVFFDVETKKIFSDIEGNDPGSLGVSIVSVYQREVDKNIEEIKGKMKSYWEKDFDKMWPVFQEADRIVGFNSKGFDIPALIPYTNIALKKLPHFDIMEKIKEVVGHRISLDAVAKETLDEEKIDVGLNAVHYWEKGDKESLEKLHKYCEDDVRITKEIYDFGIENSHILFKNKWNTLVKVELDFSYPKESPQKQQGLF
jgi:uncharacterized protein YprB with RNaseH-like and TPR domain